MTIEGSAPSQTAESNEAASNELQTLLAAYARTLEAIDDGPSVLWVSPRRRLLHWVGVPAPRLLVRTFLRRHVSRSVAALKRKAACRAALADDESTSQRDLKLLEQFEQSLPKALGLAAIWPLALLAGLSVAYLLGTYVLRIADRGLLGALVSASVNLDRQAAIGAFKDRPFGPDLFLGTMTVVACSVLFVILPLLPAFLYKRQKLGELACAEKSAFAALGARRVYDFEFDLFTVLILVTPLALLGVVSLGLAVTGVVANQWPVTILLLAPVVPAYVALRARYSRRRGGAARAIWGGCLNCLSLILAGVISIAVVICATFLSQHHPSISAMEVGELVVGPELSFTVTSIEQNAACNDPFRPLKPGEQFLRFDLDVSSEVDQFTSTTAASSLNIRHWSVTGRNGVRESALYVYAKCGDESEDVSRAVVPGTHTRPVIVVSAPLPAEFLQLDVGHGDAMRWRIPPAVRP